MSRYDHKIETSLEGIDGKGDTEKRNHGESSRKKERNNGERTRI